MRYKHDSHIMLILHTPDEFNNTLLRCDIKCRCRLIAEKIPRSAYSSHGNHRSLAHTAGQLMRIAFVYTLRFRQLYINESFQDPALNLLRRAPAARYSMESHCLAKLSADTHGWVEACHWLLKYHRNILSPYVRH